MEAFESENSKNTRFLSRYVCKNVALGKYNTNNTQTYHEVFCLSDNTVQIHGILDLFERGSRLHMLRKGVILT